MLVYGKHQIIGELIKKKWYAKRQVFRNRFFLFSIIGRDKENSLVITENRLYRFLFFFRPQREMIVETCYKT